jgi:DNA replication initiation complex subunit (GINS family)
MHISNKEELGKAIANLEEAKDLQKSLLLNHFELIQQSIDPVFLLKRRLLKIKPKVPRLFNNLIDQSFFSATDAIRNKTGLNKNSFITKAAGSIFQKKINQFFSNNHLKIKAVVLATAKNIFR